MSSKPKLKGSKNARLSMARLAAVQCVYQWFQAETTAKDLLDHYEDYYAGMITDEGEELLPPDRDLLVNILSGVQKRFQDISSLIDTHIDKAEGAKPLSKDLLLRAVLYCGGYELVAHTQSDTALIISEYINVTRAFYDGHETKLVNAVLDSFAKTTRM